MSHSFPPLFGPHWGEEAAAKTFFGKTKVEKVKVWLNAGTDVPTASVTIGNIAAVI